MSDYSTYKAICQVLALKLHLYLALDACTDTIFNTRQACVAADAHCRQSLPVIMPTIYMQQQTWLLQHP